MWFLKKTSLFSVICHALLCTLPTGAAGPLRSTSRSFNKTGHSDIVTDSNDVEFFTNNATLYSDERSRRRLLDTAATADNNKRDPIRILYTVTTLSEFDKGTRATTRVSHIQNCCSYSCLVWQLLWNKRKRDSKKKSIQLPFSFGPFFLLPHASS
jgi:hypothetical protein